MSVKPSARRSSSATYWGVMQMPAIFASRTVVVSGGPSWASELCAPIRPAAPAADTVARKRRRLCAGCIMCLLSSKSGQIDHADPPLGVRLLRPSRTRCVKVTIPRHERAVPNSAAPGTGGAQAGHRLQTERRTAHESGLFQETYFRPRRFIIDRATTFRIGHDG